MDALKIWVITLVSASVIVTIIEKFAPEGGINKYVRLVCGLVLTIIIASPIVRFLGGEFNIEPLAYKDYLTLSKNDMERRVSRLEEQDSRQLLELYRTSILTDIKERFDNEEGFRIAEVDLVLREDYGSAYYGEIRAIYVKVGPTKTGKAFDEAGRQHLINDLAALLSIEKEKIVIDNSLFDKGGQ